MVEGVAREYPDRQNLFPWIRSKHFADWSKVRVNRTAMDLPRLSATVNARILRASRQSNLMVPGRTLKHICQRFGIVH